MSIEQCAVCNFELDTDVDDSGTYMDEDYWCESCYENNLFELRSLLD